MAKTEPYFVGIDIGSSKVGVLIGQRDDKGGIEVVGKGLAPNRGTRKGNIVNVEATVEALKAASEEAEVMACVEISRAYVGVAGADIRSVNSRGMVSVARKDREITRQDIQRVLEAAQSAALPSDREILHAIPQEFIVDEQGGIDDPIGMLGTRLEVMVHLVTGNITRSRTLLTSVNRAGIEVVQMVFEPLATAEAVLTPDERRGSSPGASSARSCSRAPRSCSTWSARTSNATPPTKGCAAASSSPAAAPSSTACSRCPSRSSTPASAMGCRGAWAASWTSSAARPGPPPRASSSTRKTPRRVRARCRKNRASACAGWWAACVACSRICSKIGPFNPKGVDT